MTKWIMPLACVFVLGACSSMGSDGMSSGSSSGMSSGSSSGTGAPKNDKGVYDNASSPAKNTGAGVANSPMSPGGPADIGRPAPPPPAPAK